MPIVGQSGTFDCNLWICQDFDAIMAILWQSFAVSQSYRNSIRLRWLRSGLPPWHFRQISCQFRLGRFESDFCSIEMLAQSVPIASGSLKIQNSVAIVRIANIEGSIAGGLRQLKGARFGDCGAPRGLPRIPEQLPGPALQSGLRPDGQPLG